MNSLSIVIPIRRCEPSLLVLLKSILRQEINFSVEVIVVLNSFEPSDFDVLKTELQVIQNELKVLDMKLIFLDRSGVNRARNAGLLAAAGSIVVFFDDDCELDSSNLLSMHALHHQAHPTLFGLGGVYKLNAEAGYFDRLYHYIQMRWLYEGLLYSEDTATRYLIGGHFSVKKVMTENYHIQFNDEVVYGGSELEFFLQAERQNLRVELSELAVIHHTNESFISLTRKLFKQGKGKAISEKRYADPSTQFRASQSVNKSKDLIGRLPVISKMLLGYYNYIFWLGYYHYRKQLPLFFRHVMQDIFLFKSKLSEQVERQKKIKEQRGDRF